MTREANRERKAVLTQTRGQVAVTMTMMARMGTERSKSEDLKMTCKGGITGATTVTKLTSLTPLFILT
jgi:hypothetical protein